MAVIVAERAVDPLTLSAVTTPAPLTVATVMSDDVQLITRAVSSCPCELCVEAVSVSMPPLDTLPVAGVTTTRDTGMGMTVSVALPAIPSLVAVIVAASAVAPVTLNAVTIPALLTVATLASEEDHVITRAVSNWPCASCVDAVSASVPPLGTLPDAGDTTTRQTRTGPTGSLEQAVNNIVRHSTAARTHLDVMIANRKKNNMSQNERWPALETTAMSASKSVDELRFWFRRARVKCRSIGETTNNDDEICTDASSPLPVAVGVDGRVDDRATPCRAK